MDCMNYRVKLLQGYKEIVFCTTSFEAATCLLDKTYDCYGGGKTAHGIIEHIDDNKNVIEKWNVKYLTNQIRNGEIIDTFLGKDEYGTLTCYLTLKGNGWSHAYGGPIFSEKDGYVTFEMLDNILTTIGVKNWKEVKGKLVRVQFTEDETKISRIGNLIEDKWFSFKEFSKE